MIDNTVTSRLQGCSFDDVLIRPMKAVCAPEEVTLESEVLAGHLAKLPILSSPMHTVYSHELARKLAGHRVLCPEPREFKGVQPEGAAWSDPHSGLKRCVTVSPFDEVGLRRAFEADDVSYVFLDTVHAHNSRVLDILRGLPLKYRHRAVLGNIATREAALDIMEFELAGVRVGLGGGSICTTSEVTGVGVPILQALEEVVTVLAQSRTKVIADGGIRNSGDIAKALAAGAHCVMLGRILAATSESGGDAKEIKGEWYKRYEGNLYPTLELSPALVPGVPNALDGFANRGRHRAEGISGYIRQTGSIDLVLEQIGKALAASLAFVGARSLDEFRTKVQLELVSKSSLEASRAHSIDIITHKDRLMVA